MSKKKNKKDSFLNHMLVMFVALIIMLICVMVYLNYIGVGDDIVLEVKDIASLFNKDKYTEVENVEDLYKIDPIYAITLGVQSDYVQTDKEESMVQFGLEAIKEYMGDDAFDFGTGDSQSNADTIISDLNSYKSDLAKIIVDYDYANTKLLNILAMTNEEMDNTLSTKLENDIIYYLRDCSNRAAAIKKADSNQYAKQANKDFIELCNVTIRIAGDVRDKIKENNSEKTSESYRRLTQSKARYELVSKQYSYLEGDVRDILAITGLTTEIAKEATIEYDDSEEKYIVINGNTYNERLKSVVNQLIPDDSNYSSFEKFKILHDWECSYVTYDDSAVASGETLTTDPANTASHVLESGWGVCGGYADLYEDLCKAAGLDAEEVFGYADLFDDESGHAWNCANLEGKYYHLDVCWDDVNGTQYEWFMRGSEYVESEYRVWEGTYDFEYDSYKLDRYSLVPYKYKTTTTWHY